MNKILLRCSAVILCISLMIVPCMADSYGSVKSFSSVKFPGAVSVNNVNGSLILVQAEDFLPYICLISQYQAEFERYFTNNIYDLALIRFNNNTSMDYVVPVMRIGTAQPISTAPTTIQVNGRLIAWDGVNDPNFTAIDFPFNNSKTVTGVDFGTRTASYLLGCDPNSRVIACNNENGEYEMIQSIKNTLTTISTKLDGLFSDTNSSILRTNTYLSQITNAILNNQYGLPSIISDLNYMLTYLDSISYMLGDVSSDVYSMLNDYISVYFPQFDSDLDSINTQLEYFYQSFQNYMDSIDSHLENIDDNVQAMHDEMSGEALKDFTVQTTDGQSPSLWQVIKNSVGWMMSPFGKFFSMIMDSTQLFNNAGNGWNVLYDVTSASETYDPERIVVP